MRKILLAVVTVALALTMFPAHAKVGNGCYAVDHSTGGTGQPVATPGKIDCAYVAIAHKATLVALTPNKIRITEYGSTYPYTTKVLYDKKAGETAPGTYPLVTTPNRFVTLTVGPDSFGDQKASTGLVYIIETE